MSSDHISSSFINIDKSLNDAIKVINFSAHQIALVINKNRQLVGVISDGDIRRAIISGIKLERKCIEKVMSKSPIYLLDGYEVSDAKKIMATNKVKSIPVLNSQRQVIDIIDFDSLLSTPDVKNTFVIMAGGYGKRMGDLTNSNPKPMLHVLGKPIIEHIIKYISELGIRSIIVSTHFKAEIIEKYLGSGSSFGVNIDYVREENPLGTAGCLRLMNFKNDLPLFVSNGDIFSKVPYIEMLKHHNKNNADLTVATKVHEIKNPFGVLKTKDQFILGIEEKPSYVSFISAGVYIISQNLIDLIPTIGKFDMTDLINAAVGKKLNVVAFPLYEEWEDIGRPDDIKTVNEKYKDYEKN